MRRGLAPSRAEAQQAVAAKRVLVNGAVAEKPARLVAAGDAVTVTGPPPRFVGRGGEKLDAALERFGIDVTWAPGARRRCVDGRIHRRPPVPGRRVRSSPSTSGTANSTRDCATIPE